MPVELKGTAPTYGGSFGRGDGSGSTVGRHRVISEPSAPISARFEKDMVSFGRTVTHFDGGRRPCRRVKWITRGPGFSGAECCPERQGAMQRITDWSSIDFAIIAASAVLVGVWVAIWLA